MLKPLAFLLVAVMSTAAYADPTCKTSAAEKKLAGAALKSFMTKCEKDAKTVCESAAKERKLAGAAKNANVKKCTGEAVG